MASVNEQTKNICNFHLSMIGELSQIDTLHMIHTSTAHLLYDYKCACWRQFTAQQVDF